MAGRRIQGLGEFIYLAVVDNVNLCEGSFVLINRHINNINLLTVILNIVRQIIIGIFKLVNLYHDYIYYLLLLDQMRRDLIFCIYFTEIR